MGKNFGFLMVWRIDLRNTGIQRSHLMKTILFSVILLGMFAGNVFAEMRTFTSSDGQRTFQGTLLGYNSKTDVVSVRNEQGQTLHFNIDLISEKDREYVKANPPLEKISLDVRFDRLMNRQDSNRGKNERVTNFEAGYKINLLNYTPQDLGKVDVEYLLIYRKDKVSGDAETRTVRGSGSVNLEANGKSELETTTVDLTNYFKRTITRSGGSGCSRCPRSQSTSVRTDRSRDSLVGCIARVKVNGQVVSTSATAPNLLRQYEEKFDSKY